MMSREEKDQHLPEEPNVLVITTPVTTTLIITTAPVTTVPTTSLSLLVPIPLEIWETILQSVRPISFNAWVREAANAKACLQMIKIDAPVSTPQEGCGGGEVESSQAEDWYPRLLHETGLCLRCGEARHFTAKCPGAMGGSALAKDPWEGLLWLDPMKKGPAKAKVQ
ncbi:UNVERIFIED_CONTAM: hypothetical protein K2H54_047165 [Gekko kuhli]